MEYRLDSPQLSEDERALLKSTANLNHLMTSATVAAAAAAATAAAGARSAKSFAAMGVAEAVEGRAAAPTAAPREERRLAHAGFSIFPCVGLLRGYSKVTFTVTFAPTIAAATRLQLHLSYKWVLDVLVCRVAAYTHGGVQRALTETALRLSV